MLTLLPPDYLEQRAELIRRQALDRRRRRQGRAIIARLDSVTLTPRERLTGPPTGQLAAVRAATTVNPPAALPIDRAADMARLQQSAALQRAAARQHGAADTCPIGFDFRGAGFD